ncbi:EF-hand domain-containing protein 1-like [Copidosoma floridanum]|uniref:EF-hand domain-containing protein 1-like n=1 Tax=Copidosoma floridanum TaxID=29053 RepID=UPI0006C9B502|nr:EF-hand domain-containing protein 1-like [Copidosoma floridanum]
MEGLSLLPGYNFSDSTTKDYRIKQTFKFLNGFRTINDDFTLYCGGDDCLGNARLAVYNDPTLTYGRPRDGDHEIKRFLPHYVLFDRKSLRLNAYFKQGIFGSADEHCRVRQVRIMYYLEDDTMAVVEKSVDNAGFSQGKLVKRSRIPRPDRPGEFYHWKDLNVAIDIEIYGVVYRAVSCDGYTREFLKSQGIDVNDPEEMPDDPYLRERHLKSQQQSTGQSKNSRSLANDKRFLFLEYNGLALSFDASWNDQLYKLRYFLDDNTISVSETKTPGVKVRGGLLLKRTKVPKNWKDLPSTYPAAYLERTDEDVREYYAPIDLKVGGTAFVFGRRFLLLDCDRFTRKYYADVLRICQPDGIPVPQQPEEGANSGGPAKRLAGEPRDELRRLFNFPKKLRYSLEMEAVRPEDEGREFVLEYSLSDGTVRINEVARRNSGRMAGCFLGAIRVPKPGDDRYYTPEDFAIGARLNVFGHWFVVTGTEPFVYEYMRANPGKFGDELRRNVEGYLRTKGLLGLECSPREEAPCEEGNVECNCSEDGEFNCSEDGKCNCSEDGECNCSEDGE